MSEAFGNESMGGTALPIYISGFSNKLKEGTKRDRVWKRERKWEREGEREKEGRKTKEGWKEGREIYRASAMA